MMIWLRNIKKRTLTKRPLIVSGLFLCLFTTSQALSCIPTPKVVKIKKDSKKILIITAGEIILNSEHKLSWKPNDQVSLRQMKVNELFKPKKGISYRVLPKKRPSKFTLILKYVEKEIPIVFEYQQASKTESLTRSVPQGINGGCSGKAKVKYISY